MSLRQLVKNDVFNVFFAANGFAELHKINDISVPVIIDDDRLLDYKVEGLTEADLLIFVQQKDLPKVPEADDQLLYDNRRMSVVSCKTDMDLLEIVLRQIR